MSVNRADYERIIALARLIKARIVEADEHRISTKRANEIWNAANELISMVERVVGQMTYKEDHEPRHRRKLTTEALDKAQFGRVLHTRPK